MNREEAYPRVPLVPRLQRKSRVGAYDWQPLRLKLASIRKQYRGEGDREYVDRLWGEWTQAYREFVGEQYEPRNGRTWARIGEPYAHVDKLERHGAQGTPRDKELERARRVISRLRSNEGPLQGRLRARHFDEGKHVIPLLALTEKDYLSAANDPQAYWEAWLEMVKKQEKRDRQGEIAKWRRSLVEKNSPSCTLFRWIRGDQVQRPLVIKDENGVPQAGPNRFFPCLREYWTDLMCATPGEDREALNERLRRDIWPIPREKEHSELLLTAAKSLLDILWKGWMDGSRNG